MNPPGTVGNKTKQDESRTSTTSDTTCKCFSVTVAMAPLQYSSLEGSPLSVTGTSIPHSVKGEGLS